MPLFRVRHTTYAGRLQTCKVYMDIFQCGLIHCSAFYSFSVSRQFHSTANRGRLKRFFLFTRQFSVAMKGPLGVARLPFADGGSSVNVIGVVVYWCRSFLRSLERTSDGVVCRCPKCRHSGSVRLTQESQAAIV